MRTLPYSVIESTQSLWDSGSRIDTCIVWISLYHKGFDIFISVNIG